MAAGNSKTLNAENSVRCALDRRSSRTAAVTITRTSCTDAVTEYRAHHANFVEKRVDKLKNQETRRTAKIVECSFPAVESTPESERSAREQYFEKVKDSVIELHYNHHTIDGRSGKRVSFGVVRFANISPCVSAAKYFATCMWPCDVDVRVMAYHSQQVLLLRHEQEKHLDKVLKRKDEFGTVPAAFNDPVIREHLDHSSADHVIFIVVATPVEEIGRDHDFDWAVIEPSSFRSIIQMAGRVRRHRSGTAGSPNIALMQYNLKAYQDGDKPGTSYFIHPGYEEFLKMSIHDLRRVIDGKALKSINAVPRIRKAVLSIRQHC